MFHCSEVKNLIAVFIAFITDKKHSFEIDLLCFVMLNEKKALLSLRG